MSNSETETVAIPPPVIWAQRNEQVFLTFNIECEKPDIRIEKKLVSFKGIGMPEQKQYQIEISLYAEINPDKSTYTNKGRMIEVILVKEKEDDAIWPYLTSDKKKHHWLKVDFNRWEDEEESEDEGNMFEDHVVDFDIKERIDQLPY